MKVFAVSNVIHAEPAIVWGLLTDGPDWTSWNTTVDKVEGAIVSGGMVKVYPKVTPGRAFPVTVSEFVPHHKMVWTGGMPLGLFRGVRTYLCQPVLGGVQFSMREEFSGLLAPLITRAIPDLQPSFEEFATALKRRAEQPVSW